jgi:hypothetical protein
MDPTEHFASGRSRPDYDQPLKWLLTRAHDAFLELIAPDLAWRGERSPEAPSIARHADLVWEVEQRDGVRGLLHIELQVKAEAEIGERLVEYFIRLWRRDHLPVRSVVVYLRKIDGLAEPPFVVRWDQTRELLRYIYEVVRLWEIPRERVLATTHYEPWPLSSLMAGASVEATVQTAQQLAALPASKEERSDLVGLLVGLSGIQFPPGAVLSALKEHPMVDELLKESGVLELLAQEMAVEAAAEAEIKGKLEGERQMARVALEGRFGTLGGDILAAIEAADEATLRVLVGNVTSDDLQQARARLGLS